MNASQLQREAASRAMKMARAAGMEKSMAQAMGAAGVLPRTSPAAAAIL